MTDFARLQSYAIEHPAARARQVSDDNGQHFADVISPSGENAAVGLTVNR